MLHAPPFVLRPYRHSDAVEVSAAVRESTETIGRWMTWAKSDFTDYDAVCWFEHCSQSRAAGTAHEFGIFTKDDEFIGGCGLNQLSTINNLCNLGYWTRQSRQRTGAATAAVLALRELALHRLKLSRIEIVVAEGNIASIAICTHGMLSFTPESMQATLDLCRAIDAAYRAAGSPVTFHGHKEIDPKPCPVYGYKTLLGLDDKGVLGASTAVPPEVVAAACRSLEVPARPPADGRRLLELGDHGEDVRELQAFLPVLADGDFGATTDAAVRVVQQAHGLAVDGVVGPNTRAALGFA